MSKKDFSKGTTPRKTPKKLTDKQINEATKKENKVTKVEKTERLKMLYVDDAHHRQAKMNTIQKGFTTIRAYIENLIDKDT